MKTTIIHSLLFNSVAIFLLALAPPITRQCALTDRIAGLIKFGSEAYTAALVVYQSAKRNGQGTALDGLLDSLGQRFARKSKESPPTT